METTNDQRTDAPTDARTDGPGSSELGELVGEWLDWGQASEALHSLPHAPVAPEDHAHLHGRRVPALVQHLAGHEPPEGPLPEGVEHQVPLPLIRV